MIEAITFIQSLNIFGNPSVENINVSDKQLSKALIKEARRFVENAETEARNGEEAKKVILSSNGRNEKQNLAQIAVWHHEVSAKYYRQAAARYDEASRIRLDHQQTLQRRSEEIMRLARKSEKTVTLLRNLNN